MQEFASKSDLQDAASEWIATRLADAIRRRGSAVFLGSGGSTPGPVYQRLATTELAWHQVWVGLTDERWVDVDHPASNGALMQKTLLTHNAAEADFVPMKVPGDDPFMAVDEVDTLYQDAALADVVLLGMGPDAHTLSWFKDAQGLDTALDPDTLSTVAAIAAPQTDVTGPNTQRMTLTLPCIAYARNVLLLITGGDKKAAYQSADPNSPVQIMADAAGAALTILYAD